MTGGNPCNSCGPKAAKGKTERPSPRERARLYEGLKRTLLKAYEGGGHWAANTDWTQWRNFATAPYVASTHGERYVVNLTNSIAAKVYGRYEKLKAMPAGGTIVKPSFTIAADGSAKPGPLFIMEKMKKGWNAKTGDWRYAMILPGGKTYGVTKGEGDANVAFCHACHQAAETDALFFLPKAFRR